MKEPIPETFRAIVANSGLAAMLALDAKTDTMEKVETNAAKETLKLANTPEVLTAKEVNEEKTTIEAEALAAKILTRLEDNKEKAATEKDTKINANAESAVEMLARLTSEAKGTLTLLCRIISVECLTNFEFGATFSIVVYELN